MQNNNLVDNDIMVDEKKCGLLIKKILIAESCNIKSNEKADTQMVKDIKKMIEEEVECY